MPDSNPRIPHLRLRRSASRGATVFTVCFPLLWPLASLSHGRDPASDLPAVSIEWAAEVVRSENVRDDALLAACEALVTHYDAPRSQEALLRGLAPSRPLAMRIALAEAIARAQTVPPRFLTPALADALDPSEPALAAAALQALSRYQSRDAVRAILDGLLAPANTVPPALRARAFEALLAQTGRVEFGQDAARWHMWWSRAQWLTEQEWRSQIASAQAAAADATRRQKSDALRLVVELYRRLHSAAPDGSRSELLVEMMSASEAEVRRTGMELTTRAQLNGKSIDDVVAEAVGNRLADTEPSIRAAAATILERLNRPSFGPALRAALGAETDPEAAAAMLRAARLEPGDSVVAAAVRWLPAGPPVSEAAVAALLAAVDAGELDDPARVAKVRGELHRLYPDQLSQIAMSLMIDLGDGQRIMDLLEWRDPVHALAAAGALEEWEPAVDALVRASRANPALRDSAVRSLRRHRLTAQGFSEAAALLDPDAAPEWQALLQFARALPDAELLRVALAESDSQRREELLAHTTSPEDIGHITEPADRIELLVLSLQTRLFLGRAADALAVLDGIPSAWFGPRLRGLRVTSLLCLGRIDDAIAYTRESAPADTDGTLLRAWLDGFAHSIDKSFAGELRNALTVQFPDVQASSEASRFDELISRLPTLLPAAAESPPSEGVIEHPGEPAQPPTESTPADRPPAATNASNHQADGSEASAAAAD